MALFLEVLSSVLFSLNELASPLRGLCHNVARKTIVIQDWGLC